MAKYLLYDFYWSKEDFLQEVLRNYSQFRNYYRSPMTNDTGQEETFYYVASQILKKSITLKYRTR